jgi:triosephosphate isomerase
MPRRKLAAGNWKMNGLLDSLGELDQIEAAASGASTDVLLCPPATLVARMADRADAVLVGGQDCHIAASGAHTGDISAVMLKDAGASHVILGHSERRADHGETDHIVAAKAASAWREGLIAVICVGETLQEREGGTTLSVVESQLAGSVPDGATADNCVIAYEPVWAIGTGKVPTTDQIAEVHAHIRACLSDRIGTEAREISLLYGGSVKASNAGEIFAVPDVDGALVGGASLKASDFVPIIEALEAS